ncbi:hypothetical protein BHE74_00031539 [Ensete ventricosum]|nr:hypothetical protein GW17_00043457 [Ensete ventricosum]RWW61399.1 hypothetical protein BHE74_00031539 [Ensete ventricosum]RZR84270.1 hypothetical protein BHM03_00011054 [Ensete ventricosum]
METDFYFRCACNAPTEVSQHFQQHQEDYSNCNSHCTIALGMHNPRLLNPQRCHLPTSFPLSTIAPPLLCYRRCQLLPLQSLPHFACRECYSPATITIAPSPSSTIVVALYLRSSAYSLLYHHRCPLSPRLPSSPSNVIPTLCLRSPNAAISLLSHCHTSTIPARSNVAIFLLYHRHRPLLVDPIGATTITNAATPTSSRCF